jgi:hypothetical protein
MTSRLGMMRNGWLAGLALSYLGILTNSALGENETIPGEVTTPYPTIITWPWSGPSTAMRTWTVS